MKIKGHTDIYLTDVKTGEVEHVSEDNMITNAISEHLANCGFLNAPNVDQDNMVVKLLGGVMAFDDEISEDATIVHAPAGLSMIANGSVGTVNDSVVLETGSWSETESGWQQDGSYVETYDYSTSQANGKIACVCLTGQDYGYTGEGNSLSGENRLSPRTLALVGTPTDYSIQGIPCRLNITESTIYGIDFSDIANGNIKIRKYRLPVTKVNLKGTKTAPVVLSETTITAPASLVSGYSSLYYNRGSFADNGDVLSILSAPNGSTWGSGYTQYLWEIDPVNATITESTLSNTSGETLYGMLFPVWMGKDCVAFINGYGQVTNDARFIFSMKRTNGTWSAIQKCANPIGITNSYLGQAGWTCGIRRTGERAVVQGQVWNGVSYVYYILNFDYAQNKVTVSNGAVQANVYHTRSYDKPLIRYYYSLNGNTATIRIQRDETYIASINNLSTPVQKTAEKTMKIVYRLTFTDQ